MTRTILPPAPTLPCPALEARAVEDLELELVLEELRRPTIPAPPPEDA